MSSSLDSSGSWSGRKLGRTAQVVVVSSVMFTFISYWRTAAIVLCDMSSTAYYIGAIVESAIGQAAPWFILAVLLFSYGMRAVYIESCSLFVRGGVYRIVKEALGGSFAKAAVSALLFDYVLTGPISGVSAGQYIVGLILETISRMSGHHIDVSAQIAIKQWGSVAIACAVTLYFLRQNLLGIHESSGKALKIMIATTVMAVIMLSLGVFDAGGERHRQRFTDLAAGADEEIRDRQKRRNKTRRQRATGAAVESRSRTSRKIRWAGWEDFRRWPSRCAIRRIG